LPNVKNKRLAVWQATGKGMALWRERLFAAMARHARTAADTRTASQYSPK
jgi:hypothetical protein